MEVRGHWHCSWGAGRGKGGGRRGALVKGEGLPLWGLRQGGEGSVCRGYGVLVEGSSERVGPKSGPWKIDSGRHLPANPTPAPGIEAWGGGGGV